MAFSEYCDASCFDREILFIGRAIDEAIKLLQARHSTHIKCYGRDNERRLTGRHETANVS
jgi:hypothetical protein